MNLDSPKVTIQKSPETVFNFLSNVKNFEHLMPESISKFEVLDDSTFLFALSGMPEITLKKKEQTPNSNIVLGAAGGKIDFNLVANIHDLNNNTSEVQLNFNGDFNPMMAMMIKSPITKFIETLVTNMTKAI